MINDLPCLLERAASGMMSRISQPLMINDLPCLLERAASGMMSRISHPIALFGRQKRLAWLGGSREISQAWSWMERWPACIKCTCWSVGASGYSMLMLDGWPAALMKHAWDV